jgi:histidinol-phosphate aminotransferase
MLAENESFIQCPVDIASGQPLLRTMSLPFTPLVQSLPSAIPFVGPETIERNSGATFEARVGANESAFGVSPIAASAMRDAVRSLAWYNDPENHDLREGLAAHHGVRPEEIAIAAGIDDLLGLSVRAFIDRGEVAVASIGAYPTFIYHVDGFGCRPSSAPYRAGRNDLVALSELAQSKEVRIVYLSNPDNPTGTWYSTPELSSFIGSLPDHCIFILDEAYTEFAPEDATPPILPIHPRVIRMRTFSKAHGLAGARVGYAICSSEIASGFDKIRLHFGVNRIAQVGALASLGDTEFIADVISKVEKGRRDYEALGRDLGLPTLPSATNFVTFDAGNASRADTILERLVAQRVFIRKPRVEALDQYFRVTVGRPEERAILAERLRDIVGSI